MASETPAGLLANGVGNGVGNSVGNLRLSTTLALLVVPLALDLPWVVLVVMPVVDTTSPGRGGIAPRP
jgi:hypothetical protein